MDESKMAAPTYTCNVCQKQFARKFTLSRHKELCHGIASEKKFQCRSSRIKCTLCMVSFVKLSELMTHLETLHDVQLTVTEREFDSRTEFDAWKESIELSTCSYYVIARNFNRKHLKTSYYDCHRSGFYERQGNKRAQKLKGTVRINGTCPARIKLVEDCESGKHKVNFISTHVGHDNEANRLRLTKQERLDIAVKIQQGVSKDEILSTIKDNFSPTRRLSYITRHDLNNIASAFNLKTEFKIDEEEMRRVGDWVQACRGGDFDPVLAYKTLGETGAKNFDANDFFMVLANDGQLEILKQHGNGTVVVNAGRQVNANGVYVTTLLVTDVNCQLIPAAFMFHTSAQSEETFQAFFRCLRDKVTILQPHTFISGDCAVIYSAWGSVFDFPEKKLLSASQVARTFDHLTSSKIANVEKRHQVRQILHVLQEEPDRILFENAFNSHLDRWIELKETKNFGLQFQAKFAGRTKEWAACYRHERDRQADIYHERWCREVETILTQNKSLVAVINEVVDAARDAFFSLVRGVLPLKLGLLRKNHKCCLEMSPESVEIVEPKTWTVPGGTVKLLDVQCLICEPNCGFVCEECGVCVHALSCTCHDFRVGFNMCKHVHFICQMYCLGSRGVTIAIAEKGDVMEEEEYLIIHLSDGVQEVEEERTLIFEEQVDAGNLMGVTVESLEEQRMRIHREIDELHVLVDRCESLEQLNMFRRRHSSLKAALEMVQVTTIPFTDNVNNF